MESAAATATVLLLLLLLLIIIIIVAAMVAQHDGASYWKSNTDRRLFTDFTNKRSTQSATALHGSETWSLTMKLEHRMRVFENRELVQISGPQGKKLTGSLDELHNEFVAAFLTDCFSESKMSGACDTNGEKRNTYSFLVGKPERIDL
jgi:hypothetical protein